ncbi:unnamed protein product [Prorocentrum cordatum]|uniref:Rab-GAP TBC domain-containing protein n=1 Tax=Prorocentrum cordatum TaxID=2364126 RepID=A0ABN9XUD9_9DINO|nr:unnamed protein product [Polarella glacialis]
MLAAASAGQGLSPRGGRLLGAADADAVKQIDLDMPRTAGGDPLLSARLSWVRAMLMRQLAEDPDLGYCQGMNLVAAIFGAAAGSYVEAYERFHTFVDGVRGLWLPGFPELQKAASLVEVLAADRRWMSHLSEHGIDPMMYLPQALLTLFASWLPPVTLLHCLPSLERGGMAGLLATTLAVLGLAEPQLLRQKSADTLMPVLRSMVDIAPDAMTLAVELHRELPAATRALAREDLPVLRREPTIERQMSRVPAGASADGYADPPPLPPRPAPPPPLRP